MSDMGDATMKDIMRKSEHLKEALQRKKDHSPGIYERYNNYILQYLCGKFPEEPDVSIQEAAVFITSRTAVMINDLLNEHDNEWRKAYNRAFRKSVVERRK